MSIHEYRAKQLLAKLGVPVPVSSVVMFVEEAVAALSIMARPIFMSVFSVIIGAGGMARGGNRLV